MPVTFGCFRLTLITATVELTRMTLSGLYFSQNSYHDSFHESYHNVVTLILPYRFWKLFSYWISSHPKTPETNSLSWHACCQCTWLYIIIKKSTFPQVIFPNAPISCTPRCSNLSFFYVWTRSNVQSRYLAALIPWFRQSALRTLFHSIRGTITGV